LPPCRSPEASPAMSNKRWGITHHPSGRCRAPHANPSTGVESSRCSDLLMEMRLECAVLSRHHTDMSLIRGTREFIAAHDYGFSGLDG
jgi:hypothetical protein